MFFIKKCYTIQPIFKNYGDETEMSTMTTFIIKMRWRILANFLLFIGWLLLMSVGFDLQGQKLVASVVIYICLDLALLDFDILKAQVELDKKNRKEK